MKGTCPNCGKTDREQIVMHGVAITGCECVSWAPDGTFVVPPRTPVRFGGGVALEAKRTDPHAFDPLDVKYDGVTLRVLLEQDRGWREDTSYVGPGGCGRMLTPAQCAAVSAHWSAQLRSRVAAAKAKERERVVLDTDPEDL